MKRCPQCLFLYPESDESCDFDQTPLEFVDEAEVDAVTNPPPKNALRPPTRKGKALPIAVAVGLVLGVLVFAIYYSFSQHALKTSAAPEVSNTAAPAAALEPVVTLPSPSPSPVVSPSPSPSPSPKTSLTGTSPARTRSATDPISTSGTRQGGKPVIMLASGGKIDADEVWRTRDGIWYRRNGIVTLLKRNQVKAIVTR
jgi:hypothetical protein